HRKPLEQLKRWIVRYKVALDYADAKERRRPTSEIEWNGEMIGDLRPSVVRRLTPNRLFALRGPPTGWSEHRRERLSGLNKPALFSCEPMGGVEIVQSSLNGDASDRGICHRLTLAQSHGDQGS